MDKLKVLELFAGIGACSKALERLGIEHEIVDAVEIDKYAMNSFNVIHGTNFEIQDITQWDKDIEVDLIMHGSPCQDFSVAGSQAGGDLGSGTRSSLMYETIRIVGKLRPKYVIWENVKNLLSKKHKHNFDSYIETMNILGYNSYYQILNAKDYGIPQNRERVFTISIRKDISNTYKFPQKQELKLRLKDILEDEVDEKYYLQESKIDKITNSNFMQEKKRIQEKDVCDTLLARDWKDPKCVRIGGIFDNETSKHQAGSIYDKEGLAPTLDAMQGGWRQPCIEVDKDIKPSVAANFEREKEQIAQTDKEIYQCKCDGGWQDNKVGIKVSPTIRAENNNTFGLTKQMRIRKLTPKECWRLMGFGDEDFYSAKYGCKIDVDTASKITNSLIIKLKYDVIHRKNKMSNTQLYKQARKFNCGKCA